MKLHISCEDRRVICFSAGSFAAHHQPKRRYLLRAARLLSQVSSFFFIFSIILSILEVSEIRNEKSSSLKYSGHWKASFVYGKGFLSSSSLLLLYNNNNNNNNNYYYYYYYYYYEFIYLFFTYEKLNDV